MKIAKTLKSAVATVLALALCLSMLPAMALIASAATQTATLVTNVATLKAGDQVIIVAVEADYALGTNQKSNNRAAAAVTKDTANTVSFGDDVQVLTLEEGTVAGTFAFNTGSGYLYAASSGSNHLKTQTTLDANGSWAITIDGTTGVATVKAQGANTRNWLRYNNSSATNLLFSCYASGQKDIAIYEVGEAVPECATHTWVDATCTNPKTCSVCGKTEGEALGHTEETIPGTAATCTATGMSDGVKCSVCDAIITAQEVVAPLGHTFVDGTCSVCGEAQGTYITLNAAGLGLTSSYLDSTEDKTIGGVNFAYAQLYTDNNSTYIQMRYKNDVGSAIWNTAAMPGVITKIVLTHNASQNLSAKNPAYNFYFGSSADALTTEVTMSTVAGTYVYTVYPVNATSTFFKMERSTLSGTFYWDSIEIHYAPEGTTPDLPEVEYQEGTIAEAVAGTGNWTVTGAVTAVINGTYYVQDSTGVIGVQLSDTAATVKVGDTITASGTRGTGTGLPMLINAIYEAAATTITITPTQATTIAAIQSEALLYKPVVLSGVRVSSINGTTVTLDDGTTTIQVYEAVFADTLAINDIVNVTAILDIYGTTYQLRNDDAADFVVTGNTGVELVVSDIADIIGSADGTEWKVTGVITYINGKEIYIQDATGAVVVYGATTDATIGQTITVIGTFKTYNGLPELTNPTVEIAETPVGPFEMKTTSSIADITDADLCKVVKLTGVKVTNVASTNNVVTLTDSNGASITIFKAIGTFTKCSVVDVIAVVSTYNGLQLRNVDASEVTVVGADHNWTPATTEAPKTCTDCGATEGDPLPAGPQLDANLTFANKAMQLGASINAQFLVNMSVTTDAGYSDVYVMVKMGDKETKLDVDINPYNSFAFAYPIPAYEMGTEMEITAYATKDGVEVKGATETWSVREGLIAILDRDYTKAQTDAATMKRCVMAVEMLYYGAAAQASFRPEATPVTNDLDSRYVALHNTEDPSITAENTPAGSGANALIAYALVAQEKVYMQFVFMTPDTNHSTYAIKVTRADGTVKEFAGEDLYIPSATSPMVVAIYEELGAMYMREVLSIELYQNGNKVSTTYTASIEGCAKLQLDGNRNVELNKAMIKFGDAAKAVFG